MAVAHLLGGVLNPTFPLYEAAPLSTPDEMAIFIRDRRATGLNRFQLEVGNDPADDLARVRAAVEASDQDTVLIADANGGRKLLQAETALKSFTSTPSTSAAQPEDA